MIPKSGYRFSEKSSKNKLERDDDSKKSHHALAPIFVRAVSTASRSSRPAVRPAPARPDRDALSELAGLDADRPIDPADVYRSASRPENRQGLRPASAAARRAAPPSTRH